MKSFDERLAALREAVAEPTTPDARKLVMRALAGKNGLFISTAIPALTELPDLLERLGPAFERLCHDANKRDPQCTGKTAIAKCLRDAETGDDDMFLRGARYVQHEPVWGGKVDTAAELRGVCMMALAERQHPRAMAEAAEGLADPEVATRTAAARAIAASGNVEVGEPLLRLRIASGEPDPDVLGECLLALLQLAPREGLPFVAERLRSRDETIVEAAALALGESRLADALAPLRERVELDVMSGRRSVLMLGIAMLRTEAAWAALLEWIEDGSRGEAKDALQALATFSHDERLAAQVRAAVDGRPDDVLNGALSELFGAHEVS